MTLVTPTDAGSSTSRSASVVLPSGTSPREDVAGSASSSARCSSYCTGDFHGLSCPNFPTPKVWGKRSRRSEFADEEMGR
jgi:hypothetical protein